MTFGAYPLPYICGMIQFNEIFLSCEQMSAYEGQRAYDANGESMYTDVHITEKDRALVTMYCRQACHLIGRVLRHIIADEELTATEYNISFVDDRSIVIRQSADADMCSLIEAYVMWQWLSNKLPERAEVWKGIHETALSTLSKIFYRLKPTLS